MKRLFGMWNTATYFGQAGHPDDGGDSGIRDIDIIDDSGNDGDDEGDDSDDEGEKEKVKDKKDKEKDTDEEDEEEEEEDDKDDEGDEDEDDEEENEELDEEEKTLELTTGIKDIKAKYPTFFKEFPDVRDAMFRDQRYSELFSSPDEAEIASKRSVILQSIEEDLIGKGDPAELLSSIKKSNEKSYEKVILSILPTVQNESKELYLRLAAVPIKQLLRSALRDGTLSDGKLSDLGKSAKWIHKYFFQSDDITATLPDELLKKDEKSDKEKEYEAKLKELDTQQYTNFKSSVDNSYITKMTSSIREALDKDDRLTEYVRKGIIKDCLSEIKDQLEKDTRYNRQMSSLWNAAKAAKFSNDFKSRIVNAALARAKSLVPETRKKLISEALGVGLKKKKNNDNKDEKVIKKVDRSNRDRDDRFRSKDKEKKPLTDLDILRS